ncbi:glycosyltransferase family 2 protein [Desulfonatronovibrio magnus]|uniref:glycosyltransferase family 2 protein n=1 Tax=Desulfonatronovibrio magnus TaxID=698827 RepID=UPI000A05438B|nr:glycosyltransferase family 2 protein [Desulfonatronovibrio magnus]
MVLLLLFIVQKHSDDKLEIAKHIINNSLAIIPAYNEEDSVGKVVQGVRSYGLDVAVVNDQSADLTEAEAKSAGAVVLNLPVRLGAWGAIQTGLRYAIRRGYKYALTIDADGQHLPQSIPYLLAENIIDDYDVIIGSCPERVSRLRKIAWTWFRNISRAEFDDLTSGLRVYNRWSMRLMLDKRAYLFDYQDMGALLMMKKHGLKITEVPVEMSVRLKGHSRVFNNWLKVCKYMLVTSSLSASKFRQKCRKR